MQNMETKWLCEFYLGHFFMEINRKDNNNNDAM